MGYYWLISRRGRVLSVFCGLVVLFVPVYLEGLRISLHSVSTTMPAAVDSLVDNGMTQRQLDLPQLPPEAKPPRNFQNKFNLPFYIYDTEFLDWQNATFYENGKWETLAKSTDNYLKYKHSDDYWLLKHAKEHPMRTKDPSKAKLFFVPTLLNAWTRFNMEKSDSQLCVKSVCNEELLSRAEDALRGSMWFQRNEGRDHVVVDSHFHKKVLWSEKRQYASRSALVKCNFISFEDKMPNRWKHVQRFRPRVNIPSFYVGHQCSQPQPAKTHDFVMVASMHPEREDFLTRNNVCNWLTNSSLHSYSVAACGGAPHCPTMAMAKYGLHVRGDSLGSQRVMDTLLNGGIPLFTDPAQYAVLPDFIPWSKLTYLVDVASENKFHASLQDKVLTTGNAEYQAKLELVEQYKDFWDHTQPMQLDAYLHRFAEKLGLHRVNKIEKVK